MLKVTTSTQQIAQAIIDDEIVILPTDTLYALAANARSDAAVCKIYAAKKRAYNMALPVLVKDLASAEALAVLTPRAKELALKHWPGALTIIARLKPGHGISQYAINSGNTVALRVPNHPIFLEVLELTGLPVTGTSANISGTLPSGNFAEVIGSLKNEAYMAISSTTELASTPSTIIDCTSDKIKLVRKGAVEV